MQDNKVYVNNLKAQDNEVTLYRCSALHLICFQKMF